MTPPPQALGSLTAHNDLLQAYLAVPVERLMMLAAVAARIRLVALGGVRLVRRHARIHSLHVDTRFDPDEW